MCGQSRPEPPRAASKTSLTIGAERVESNAPAPHTARAHKRKRRNHCRNDSASFSSSQRAKRCVNRVAAASLLHLQHKAALRFIRGSEAGGFASTAKPQRACFVWRLHIRPAPHAPRDSAQNRSERSTVHARCDHACAFPPQRWSDQGLLDPQRSLPQYEGVPRSRSTAASSQRPHQQARVGGVSTSWNPNPSTYPPKFEPIWWCKTRHVQNRLTVQNQNLPNQNHSRNFDRVKTAQRRYRNERQRRDRASHPRPRGWDPGRRPILVTLNWIKSD